MFFSHGFSPLLWLRKPKQFHEKAQSRQARKANEFLLADLYLCALAPLREGFSFFMASLAFRQAAQLAPFWAR
jgi:hypothetical protein